MLQLPVGGRRKPLSPQLSGLQRREGGDDVRKVDFICRKQCYVMNKYKEKSQIEGKLIFGNVIYFIPVKLVR
jgi:hypothetical protein